ncbi:MAG: MurR/RpiR family transcriptional regulator [Candidatus Omnitrophica bacterium]|nr:MurR/RpiR family transcriptional regulator [Candidatus Omnitrophota bacterium]
MGEQQVHLLMKKICERRTSLTPKGQILGDYILKNPRKVVFMTTRELAAACQVSEATVVRFVSQLGYEGYGEFLQALRDLVDAELTLLDRVDLSDMNGPGAERFRRVVFEEIDNLKELYAKIDMDVIDKVMDYLQKISNIYVIGSRISYTFAYYMGWSLTKVRQGIRILKGSDSTTIDWLTIAPPDSFVVIIANSRYPNELIKVGKLVRRLGMTLLVIADSSLCPLIQFAHMTLIAPSKHFPLIGSPTPLSCLINYIVIELASRDGKELKVHQEKLEQSYRENDILFNIDIPSRG